MRLPPLPVLEGRRKRIAYGLLFALAFLLALQRTFPAEAVRERLTLEAAALGWQVSIRRIAPSGFAGVRMLEVTLETGDGALIPLEEARASLRLWPLLLGRRSVAFDLRLFEGRLSGVAEEGRGVQRLALTGRGIDLGRAAALRRATGLDLAGTLTADVDVTLDPKNPQGTAGRVEIAVERAAVNGGQLAIPGMSGGLTLPRIALGTVRAVAPVKAGKAEFEKLEAKGQDVEIAGEQLYFMVQPRLEYAPLFGRAKLRIGEGFWQASGTAPLRPIAEAALATAKGRDGAYTFQIYGSLGHPQARPLPQ